MISTTATRGIIALLDDCDADLLDRSWHATAKGYIAARAKPRHLGTVYMHRIILGRVLGRELLPTEQVDHRNLIKSDNRRDNLRLATGAQNQQNQFVDVRSSTGYKGVQFRKDAGRYHARINNQHLGYFDDPLDAARAYDRAATALYGEFAQINGVSE